MPPTAPRPTTTTSVSLRLVAMGRASVQIETGGRLVEHVCVVRRTMVRLQLLSFEHLLIGSGDRRSDAGISNEIPPDKVGIAAVERIAERPLNRVGSEHGKKRRGA